MMTVAAASFVNTSPSLFTPLYAELFLAYRDFSLLSRLGLSTKERLLTTGVSAQSSVRVCGVGQHWLFFLALLESLFFYTKLFT